MSVNARNVRLLGLLGWLALVFVAGAIGALASISAADFYTQLDRPAWAPPASLFGPAWTVLYVLMAVAAWLVWRARGFAGARVALTLFIVQLAFNALWTWVFFEWRRGALAFVVVVVLWLLIAATLVAFWRQHRLAGILLLPYLAWVSFASALTWSVWQRNPSLLG
jgi:tryptophan-rich sensory protein